MTTRTNSRRPKSRLWFGIVFGCLVALCLAQVTWWIVFQLQEADRLDHLATAIETENPANALGAYGADSVEALRERAAQQRSMFALEGATLGILILLGVLFLYTALMRERRIRKERTRFLTGATHELKTPLATIRLGLESIGRASMPEDRRETYVKGMLREADRLETGVTNILVAGGLESTSRQDWVTDDLALELGRLLDNFDERASSQQIRIIRQAFDSCPVRRSGDTLRIAIHNLCDNAIKFSEPGDTIDVRLERTDRLAVLTIRDTGHGIDPQEMPRIFDRFHRAGPDHIGGTGLGLAIVREIVEHHGGSVRAESKGLGHGSVFRVTLPIDSSTPGEELAPDPAGANA
ncbi:MAG: HAMP domain-containing sensor histidine kinase [Planctomycetota bacterium]